MIAFDMTFPSVMGRLYVALFLLLQIFTTQSHSHADVSSDPIVSSSILSSDPYAIVGVSTGESTNGTSTWMEARNDNRESWSLGDIWPFDTKESYTAGGTLCHPEISWSFNLPESNRQLRQPVVSEDGRWVILVSTSPSNTSSNPCNIILVNTTSGLGRSYPTPCSTSEFPVSLSGVVAFITCSGLNPNMTIDGDMLLHHTTFDEGSPKRRSLVTTLMDFLRIGHETTDGAAADTQLSSKVTDDFGGHSMALPFRDRQYEEEMETSMPHGTFNMSGVHVDPSSNYFALNIATEKVMWAFTAGSEVLTWPVSESDYSAVTYKEGSNNKLGVLDMWGNLLWSRKVASPGQSDAVETMLAGEAILYVSMVDIAVYNATNGTQLWRKQVFAGAHRAGVVSGLNVAYLVQSNKLPQFFQVNVVDGSTGTEVWNSTVFFNETVSLGVANDGTVLVLCRNYLHALSAKSGSPVWSWYFTDPLMSFARPLPGANSTVLLLTETHLWGLSMKTGQPLWQFSYQFAGKTSTIQIASSPDGNTVYFSPQGTELLALQTSNCGSTAPGFWTTQMIWYFAGGGAALLLAIILGGLFIRRRRLARRQDKGLLDGTSPQSRGSNVGSDARTNSSGSSTNSNGGANNMTQPLLQHQESGVTLHVPQWCVVQPQDLILGKMIAAGGAAAVFEATWQHTLVAAKRINVNFDDGLTKSLADEVTLLSQIRHPNVVNFLGACYEPPCLYLLMEYCPLGNLGQVLKNHELSLAKRLSFARDIARGMSFLHSKNVIHRDLKSPNVFVMEDMSLKIGDLGLSRMMSYDRLMTPFVGTILWQAPEVMQNQVYSAAADVYSYAIVVWEIFRPQTMQLYPDMWAGAVIQNVVTGMRPTMSSSIPPSIRDLIEECWQAEPENRPTFLSIVKRLEVMTVEQLEQEIRDAPALGGGGGGGGGTSDISFSPHSGGGSGSGGNTSQSSGSRTE